MAKVIAWDIETWAIEPGSLTPPLVCLSASGGADTLGQVHPAGRIKAGVYPSAGAWWRVHVDGTWDVVVTAEHALDLLLCLVEASDTLVAHNGPFDWLVMCHENPELLPLLVYLLEEGRVADTQVREMLICIGKGWFTLDPRTGTPPKGFSLSHSTKARFGADLGAAKKGDDVWRLRYKELKDLPLDQWPEEPILYSASDSRWTRKVYLDQSTPIKLPAGVLVDEEGYVTNEGEQTCAALALHAMACHGVRTDAPAVEAFEKWVREQVALAEVAGKQAGFMVVNRCKECEGTGISWHGTPHTCEVCQAKDHEQCNDEGLYGSYKNGKFKEMVPPGSKTKKSRLQALVSQGYGGQPPMTEYDANKHKSREKFKPQVKTDTETLAGSGNPLLEKYAEGSFAIKLLGTYVPILHAGVHQSITSYPNVLVRSGRTSWSKPNFQNPPTKGGFRDCFIPRSGKVFASIDYASVEMCTWAQVCLTFFGKSDLAEAINAGKDPNLVLALDLMASPVPYDEAKAIRKDDKHPRHAEVEEARDGAKMGNYGFMGMLGVPTFVEYAQGFGQSISFNRGQEIKDAWKRRWSESADYRDMISTATSMGRFTARQLGSGRLRGECSFTSGANTYFQGLAADGAKCAMWELFKAMYVNTSSPLYGVRAWAFVHDEFLFEGDETTAHLWAPEASRIMVEAMRRYVPDVKIEAEPALMRRWLKKAKAVYNKDGHLVPWEE